MGEFPPQKKKKRVKLQIIENNVIFLDDVKAFMD